ncbi:hypothetical protein Leryth_003025 [Lithospermum erythrorhizon]|uniref:Uncharacterized protein n=1 Tax=Lithospermum erythrorhizon TaxID=34254 RepID=A0AAV3PWK8_LITER|nr:hypothetical protein Leryth_003025 [Lithospermum erythrorhizon]
MKINLIVGLFLVLLCCGSILEEETVENVSACRSNSNIGLSNHEVVERKGANVGGGAASIVRQPPSQKSQATPWKMLPLFNVPRLSLLWLLFHHFNFRL